MFYSAFFFQYSPSYIASNFSLNWLIDSFRVRSGTKTTYRVLSRKKIQASSFKHVVLQTLDIYLLDVGNSFRKTKARRKEIKYRHPKTM